MKRFLIYFCLSLLLILGTPLILSNHPVKAQTSLSQLVQNGRTAYDNEQYQKAVEYFQDAQKQFNYQENKLNQAIVLSNLSLAYQQLGEWEQAEKAIQESLQLLGINLDRINFKSQENSQFLNIDLKKVETQTHSNFTTNRWQIIASVFNTYGRFWYQRGQLEKALGLFKTASLIYQKLNQPSDYINSLFNQIQALQTLGHYTKARSTIEEILPILETLSPLQQIQVWRTVGEVFLKIGEPEISRQFLEKSFSLSEELNQEKEKQATLLSLGNTLWSLGKQINNRQETWSYYNIIPWQCSPNLINSQALSFYQQADKIYQQVSQETSETALKAQINRLTLLTEIGHFKEAIQVQQQINFGLLPPSRSKVYAQIKVARQQACLRQLLSQKLQNYLPFSWLEIDHKLQQAEQDSRSLKDPIALSYSLGNRGGLYEYLAENDPNNANLIFTAQKLTNEALLLTQPDQNSSVAYQWQWQQGRLWKNQRNTKKALNAYQKAIKTLETVRGDIVSVNASVQFSFRDNVEPLYRQYVDLLLKEQDNNYLNENQRLNEAISVIDALQLAELENFLQCDLSTQLQVEKVVSELDPTAAFIYPIILSDRIEIIFKFPQSSLQHRTYQINQSTVEQVTRRLQQNLARPDRTAEVREDGQILYNWLIHPLETELIDQETIKNLIFVLDSSLRNIPMAVLYNQGQYLIEKYGVAVIPSRQIFDPRPRQPTLNVLTAGVSVEQQIKGVQFTKLPYVPTELSNIQQVADSPSQPLLNETFTPPQFSQQLQNKNFSIVHIATHGQFSSDQSQTYLLAWGKQISLTELDQILRINRPSQGIELLVLSACQTAQGNRRAALGIAGVAAKAKVRSTVATLWQVEDQTTTDLMTTFYQQLRDGKTIADALRTSQLHLLKGSEKRPHYWASFVIVGNWL